MSVGLGLSILRSHLSLSDFCFGNSLQNDPALTLTNILLEERGIASDHMIYEAFTYYQSVRFSIFVYHFVFISNLCLSYFIYASSRVVQLLIQ